MRASTVQGLAEQQLVRRARQGDFAAFEELYKLHVNFVWSRVTRFLGMVPDCEDVMQNIFFDVHCQLPNFREDSHFRTFLHRLIINVCREYVRVHPGLVRLQDFLLNELPGQYQAPTTPEENLMQAGRLAASRRLLDQIKPRYREVFMLRVVDGLGLEEISAIVGAGVPTVWSRLQRAERDVAKLLKRQIEKQKTLEARL